jgi:autotransporter-associated beta strand protein
MLTFSPSSNDTYTICDAIMDEAGSGVPSSNLGNGPDGLPAGGGSGAWGLQMTGDGTLVLQGDHGFSGPITVSSGELDLSSYTNAQTNELILDDQAVLCQQPSAALNLKLSSLTVSSDAQLFLNGYSSISVSTSQPLSADGAISIDIDPTGFVSGTPVTLISASIPAGTTVSLSSSSSNSFTPKVTCGTNGSIAVTMSAPS